MARGSLGVADLDAPLREGSGMPGAALVELSHAIAGIELTPGSTRRPAAPRRSGSRPARGPTIPQIGGRRAACRGKCCQGSRPAVRAGRSIHDSLAAGNAAPREREAHGSERSGVRALRRGGRRLRLRWVGDDPPIEPRPACGCACSSAASRTRQAISRARRARLGAPSGTPARAAMACTRVVVSQFRRARVERPG